MKKKPCNTTKILNSWQIIDTFYLFILESHLFQSKNKNKTNMFKVVITNNFLHHWHNFEHNVQTSCIMHCMSMAPTSKKVTKANSLLVFLQEEISVILISPSKPL